jgi:Flp pilus assembly protein TadG
MLTRTIRYFRNCEGMAATEFALIAPIMIALFLGTVELSDALICDQKVDGLAATASDLVAQSTTVHDSDITNIFNALNSVLYPYASANAKVVITSLVDDGKNDGKATVAWSAAQNATARTVGTSVAVPTGVVSSGGSVIFGEVTYSYTSLANQYIIGTINMTSSFYSKPRRSATVTRVSP